MTTSDDHPIGDYLANLPMTLNQNTTPTGEEIYANIQRLFARKTLFTSREDAPAVMLGVEADPLIGDRVQVQGSQIVPPGMAILVDPSFLPPPVPQKPDPLMGGDAMDLDANDAYWRPE